MGWELLLWKNVLIDKAEMHDYHWHREKATLWISLEIKCGIYACMNQKAHLNMSNFHQLSLGFYNFFFLFFSPPSFLAFVHICSA